MQQSMHDVTKALTVCGVLWDLMWSRFVDGSRQSGDIFCMTEERKGNVGCHPYLYFLERQAVRAVVGRVEVG